MDKEQLAINKSYNINNQHKVNNQLAFLENRKKQLIKLIALKNHKHNDYITIIACILICSLLVSLGIITSVALGSALSLSLFTLAGILSLPTTFIICMKKYTNKIFSFIHNNPELNFNQISISEAEILISECEKKINEAITISHELKEQFINIDNELNKEDYYINDQVINNLVARKLVKVYENK